MARIDKQRIQHFGHFNFDAYMMSKIFKSERGLYFWGLERTCSPLQTSPAWVLGEGSLFLGAGENLRPSPDLSRFEFVREVQVLGARLRVLSNVDLSFQLLYFDIRHSHYHETHK